MQTIYFSERLLCQLERLHTVPLTLVEAPAGYGKTTALKHALRDVPHGALRWHNAQDATVCSAEGDADVVLVMGKPKTEKEVSIVDANFFMD